MLYSSLAQGKQSQSTSLQIQYTDYAVWQRQWFDGGRLEERVRARRRAPGGMPGRELARLFAVPEGGRRPEALRGAPACRAGSRGDKEGVRVRVGKRRSASAPIDDERTV